MVSALERQLAGFSLTTAEILYRLPHHRTILQSYVWQDYDQAPDFPQLVTFLDFWQREIEGPLHSVSVTCQRLISPGEYRNVRYERFH